MCISMSIVGDDIVAEPLEKLMESKAVKEKKSELDKKLESLRRKQEKVIDLFPNILVLRESRSGTQCKTKCKLGMYNCGIVLNCITGWISLKGG